MLATLEAPMSDNSNVFLEKMVSAAFLGLFIGDPHAIRIGRAMSFPPCRMTSKGYPAPRKVFLDAFHVAGMRHYDARRVIDLIRPGDQLRLRAEPDNPHDPHAVEVLRGMAKLGYVPRGRNSFLSMELQRVHFLSCTVLEVREEDFPYDCLRVEMKTWA